MQRPDHLEPIDHARRVARLVADLVEQPPTVADGPIDTLVLLDLTDVRWLTGFGGSNGWCVVRRDGVVLGTDGRYRERALAETDGTGVTVVAEQSAPKLRTALLEAIGTSPRVGLDPGSATYAVWSELARDVPLAPLRSPVLALRQIKDDAEIARIEAAAAAADAALAEVEPLLLDAANALTEADVRDELEYRMRRHGADDRSFETIVASGPLHAARPHHETSRRRIVEGDTVIVDVGALVDGYHSDMTRSWVVGDADDRQRDLYQVVSAAHAAGVAAVGPGVAARAVDAAARSVIAEAGLDEWFVHGTGHGVGLVIHEPPFESRVSDDVIAAGNVVTVEPGLYREGFGGFRIEDLLVVTDTGSRVVTQSPQRELS